MSTITAKIVHPNQYFAVAGKLQKMKVGTEITVTQEQAKKLGKKISVLKHAQKVDVSHHRSKSK